MKERLAIFIVRGLLYILQGIGISLVISPLALYWWTHGDYNRYLWIISGPSPFNNFGSGPYQLRLYGILLLAGGVLTCLVVILKNNILNKNLSNLDVHK